MKAAGSLSETVALLMILLLAGGSALALAPIQFRARPYAVNRGGPAIFSCLPAEPTDLLTASIKSLKWNLNGDATNDGQRIVGHSDSGTDRGKAVVRAHLGAVLPDHLYHRRSAGSRAFTSEHRAARYGWAQDSASREYIIPASVGSPSGASPITSDSNSPASCNFSLSVRVTCGRNQRGLQLPLRHVPSTPT